MHKQHFFLENKKYKEQNIYKWGVHMEWAYLNNPKKWSNTHSKTSVFFTTKIFIKYKFCPQES